MSVLYSSHSSDGILNSGSARRPLTSTPQSHAGGFPPPQRARASHRGAQAVLATKLPPSLTNVAAGPGNDFPRPHSLHDLEGLQAGGWSDPFGPERAADERGLGGLHDMASPYRSGNRVTVSQRLAEHRHIRLDAVFLVQPSEGFAEARRALVEDQHDVLARCELPDLLQKR